MGRDGDEQDPNKGHLDSLQTSRPILVIALDGHIALVNSRGLALAGITADTPDPPGGEIRRDKRGDPTGILLDNAIGLATDVVPDPTTEQNARALEAAFEVMTGQGITSYLDAAAGEQDRAALAYLSDAGNLPLRPSIAPVVEAEDAADPARLLDELEAIRAEHGRPDIAIRTVKMFFDGVIEYPTQTAAMLRPYRKKVNGEWRPGKNRGPTYFPQEIADRSIAALDAAGWQVHVHAIGDRAVRSALDAFEHTRATNGHTDNRHTIAHVEIVHPKDLARFGALGVLPNMQLHWAERDDYTIDKLKRYIGNRRWRYTYPAGSLQRAEATLCGGSDWPVDPLLPFRQIEIAINRKVDEVYAGYPKPLFAGREGLSRKGSILMHIRNSAFQLFQEDMTGRIMPGLEADLIVLDRDPFDVKLKKLSNTNVLLTMLAGRVVHGSTELG
jgi:predicted amidohydrolase YtcJ